MKSLLEQLREARDQANRLGRLVIILSLPPESRVTGWLYWIAYGKVNRN